MVVSRQGSTLSTPVRPAGEWSVVARHTFLHENETAILICRHLAYKTAVCVVLAGSMQQYKQAVTLVGTLFF